MIQLIFNATPEKAGFSWDWISSLVGVFIGFGLTWIRDWWNNKKAVEKEKEEFKQIKKRIPEVIKTVKKGLDENPLATTLYFECKSIKKEKTAGGPLKYEYFLRFGRYSKPISKELYDKKFDIEKFLDNYQLAQRIEYDNRFGLIPKSESILSPYFLDQIQKCG